MSFISELSDLLEDEGAGTLGTDLFIGEIPNDINNGVMLVAVPTIVQDPWQELRTSDVDFWARNEVSPTAYDKLQYIWDLLHRRANYDLPSYHVFISSAQSQIEDLDKDSNGRKLHKLKMRFTFRVEQEIS